MRRILNDLSRVEEQEFHDVLRRQFVVRDEDQFITSFDPEDGGTLYGALDDLLAHFHEPDGEGYDETDMVIWQDSRIVAVVRRGKDGAPIATVFGGPNPLSFG